MGGWAAGQGMHLVLWLSSARCVPQTLQMFPMIRSEGIHLLKRPCWQAKTSVFEYVCVCAHSLLCIQSNRGSCRSG